MEKIIIFGLQKNFKCAIFNKDKKMMQFVKYCFQSIVDDYKDKLKDRIIKNIQMCDFFLSSFKWR